MRGELVADEGDLGLAELDVECLEEVDRGLVIVVPARVPRLTDGVV
jgi:hypothetical protein